MKLEDLISDSIEIESVDELFVLYTNFMKELGLDRVLFALINSHPRLMKEAEHGVFYSYPETWVQHNLQSGYDCIDPVRHRIFSHVGPFTWEELIGSGKLTDKQLLLFNEAKDARLFSGLGVALHGPAGAIAGIGAASSEKDIDLNDALLNQANLASNQFYTCYWRLMEKENAFVPIKLTDKEREVLMWSASGMTKSQIADKLTISVHTVDFHIRNCLRKLEARNITSAVVRALNMGLIQI